MTGRRHKLKPETRVVYQRATIKVLRAQLEWAAASFQAIAVAASEGRCVESNSIMEAARECLRIARTK